jgi:hypothetical protein
VKKNAGAVSKKGCVKKIPPCAHWLNVASPSRSHEENRGLRPRFSFGASESVCHVVGGRVVSGVVQVLDVQVVSAEGIGGNGTLGNGSGGVALVVLMLVLRSVGGTSDDESSRSGQNKSSHDMIPLFLFLKAERRTPS